MTYHSSNLNSGLPEFDKRTGGEIGRGIDFIVKPSARQFEGFRV
jgi:hypothetical protein